MVIINIEQGTETWIQLRKSKISSSDSAIINGTNTFKGRSKRILWEEKLGLRELQPINKKMTRGSELEEPARKLICHKFRIDFVPKVVIHDSNDWCMTSLDGISPCGQYVIEIKAPSKDSHEDCISGSIRPYYFCQCQHHLYCTGAKICYYCSYFPGHEQELAIIEILPDLEYIAKLIQLEQEFWIQLCTMQPPPEPWKLKEK